MSHVMPEQIPLRAHLRAPRNQGGHGFHADAVSIYSPELEQFHDFDHRENAHLLEDHDDEGDIPT